MRAISFFDPWKNTGCSCPPKYSFSPYSGCGHGCLYCYASSYINNFFNPRPKKNILKKIEKDLTEIPAGEIINLSTSSDPYQPLEKTHRVTENVLRLLAKTNKRLLINTKSPLVLRDKELLRDIPCAVVFTITSLNPALIKKLEPGTEPPEKKLHATSLLSKNIPVIWRLDPIIPGINETEIPAIIKAGKEAGISQIISSTYKIRPDNFFRMCRAFPSLKNKWKSFYFQNGENFAGSRYLNKKTRENIISLTAKICKENGLSFSSCRENLAALNTAQTCDGSGRIRHQTGISLFQRP